MVEWLKENRNRILITFNHQEAARLRETYPDLALSIFGWEEWIRNQYGVGGEKEIGIDNADILLQNHLKHPLVKLSLESE